MTLPGIGLFRRFTSGRNSDQSGRGGREGPSTGSNNVGSPMESRVVILLYDLAVLAALGTLVALYFGKNSSGSGPLRDLVPSSGSVPPIGLYAAWFGALGAVVASMKGIYDHRLDWDNSMALWHFGRPFTGGIVGGVAYLLLLVANQKGETPSQPVVEVVAFVLGTQDRRFFNFLYEVAKLVVTVPGEEEAALGISGVSPSSAPASAAITIAGTGFAEGATVLLGTYPVEDVVVAKDGTRIDGRVPVDMPAGKGKVDVTVRNPNGIAFVKSDAFEVQETATTAEGRAAEAEEQAPPSPTGSSDS